MTALEHWQGQFNMLLYLFLCRSVWELHTHTAHTYESILQCFGGLSLSLQGLLSHAIHVYLFAVSCKIGALQARSRRKHQFPGAKRNQLIYLQFPSIMWEGVDWISCYYSQYKAEKASKKFEDWPWPDWE